MKTSKYSAGAVKLSFWFAEFRNTIRYLNEGKTFKYIKALNEEENIYLAASKARANQIFRSVSKRASSIDASFYRLFEESDVNTQKIIVLIAIMNTDALFFDFVYEVYREKLIIGSNTLTDSDIRVFFKNKQLQDERVAGWRDYTLKRLGVSYKTMLMEAGLTDRSLGDRKLLKPILDDRLVKCLGYNNMQIFIDALTGVR